MSRLAHKTSGGRGGGSGGKREEGGKERGGRKREGRREERGRDADHAFKFVHQPMQKLFASRKKGLAIWIN